MHFQLLIGIYNDIRTGQHFTAGDIIKTDADLVKSFGSDKFRRLSNKEIAAMQNQDEIAGTEQPKRKRVKRKSL